MSSRVSAKSFSFASISGCCIALLLALLHLNSLAATMEVTVKLTGAQEVPAVDTQAQGEGILKIGDDGNISGTIKTTNLAGTMAHIHQAPAGANGGVVIPLEQAGPSGWAVPAGAHLTADQLKSFNAGDMYVNVHSKAHPGGEIRGQIMP